MRGSGRRLLAALAGATVLTVSGLATAGLRSGVEYPVGNQTLEAEFVRLPGDRRLDVVVTNRGDDDLSVLRGRRNGRLRQAVDVAAGDQPLGIAAGDFNRDGRADVAVANQSAGTGGVTILLSLPGGGFDSPPQTVPVSQEASYIVAARLTPDRHLDLAVTSFAENDVTILRGNAAGQFSLQGSIEGKAGAFPIGAGDFDRDGDADLVVGGEDHEIDFYANDGVGGFAAGVPTPAGEFPNGIAVGRINRDRRLDVAVANFGGQGSVSVLLGNGDGTFRRRQIDLSNENSPADIEIFRFNDDRFADLAYTDNQTNRLVLLRGKRGARFRPPVRIATGVDPYGMAAGRLHGDRLTDIAAVNYTDETVSVFRGR